MNEGGRRNDLYASALVRQAGDTAELRFEGELDLSVADSLREDLNRHVAMGRRHLALDFSAVSFLDSRAVSALLAVRRETDALGGSLTITAVQPHVRRALDILGLTQVFGLERE